jgi:integrase
MAKIHLTDRFIASPKRVPPAGRVDYQDAQVPGLALRVTAAGHRSYVLVARYPMHPKHPTRRAIGDHGVITLENARDTAREWVALIKKGVDPKVEQSRQRAAAFRQQTNTFAMVADQFLERHASGLAKAAEAKRIIDAEFVKRWGPRPITDILPEEAAASIRAIVRRDAPYQAHNAFGYLRRLFNWAIGTHEFGLTVSPVERLSPKDLIGKREARERTLIDAELRAIWNTAGGKLDAGAIADARSRDPKRVKEAEELIGYPYGPLFRMLILTGQREREVADMEWSEVDFDQALWTIPASRMKGDRAHEVPLAPQALALLRSLPRFAAGDHVFTTTDGTKSVNGFSKAKARMDKLSGVAAWKIHDLRRTMRTHLSALPVQDMVRELVIAHAKTGLHKVYDRHSYLDEKRECLTLWEARLAGIVMPKPPGMVADLIVERARRQAAE